MIALVIGERGQLATALKTTAPKELQVNCVGRDQLDAHNNALIEAYIRDTQPDWIINAAAYTAVDKAETDKEAAFALNAELPKTLAKSAQAQGKKLIHISTDFVFDGSCGTPYKPTDSTNPLSVYGTSKLAGEIAVRTHCANATIIRTSWVFSPTGSNFVKTMLRLMSERDELNVVDDQIGSPTSAEDLARYIWALVANGTAPADTLHWTNAGVCSWYDFAVAIEEMGRRQGLLSEPTAIRPIASRQYPTPAKRPSYSVLDKTSAWQLDNPAQHWRCALAQTLEQLATI